MASIEFAPEAWKHLLEPRHVVHFIGSHPEYWQQRVAGKYFKVAMTQQINYERGYILGAGLEHEEDISEDVVANGDLGLYPDNSMTLYEILLGMKTTSGSVLIYPRAPPNEWYLTLEEGQFIPNPASNDYRYLGPWNEDVTPADRPQVRISTIKDEESVGIRIYNDCAIAQKAVLSMVVNRCLLKQVAAEELTDKELERARELLHFGLMARGKWGETVP